MWTTTTPLPGRKLRRVFWPEIERNVLCRDAGRLGSVLPAFAVGYVLAMSVVDSLLFGRADAVAAVRG